MDHAEYYQRLMTAAGRGNRHRAPLGRPSSFSRRREATSAMRGLASTNPSRWNSTIPGGTWEGRVPPRPRGVSASTNPSRWNSTIPGGIWEGRVPPRPGSFSKRNPIEMELDNPGGGGQFARPGMVCRRDRSSGSSRSHRVGPSHRVRPASCNLVRVSRSTSAWLQRIRVNGAGCGAC